MSHCVVVSHFDGELKLADVSALVAHFGLGGRVCDVLCELGCKRIEDVVALRWRDISDRATEVTHRRIMLLQEYAKAAGWVGGTL